MNSFWHVFAFVMLVLVTGLTPMVIFLILLNQQPAHGKPVPWKKLFFLE